MKRRNMRRGGKAQLRMLAYSVRRISRLARDGNCEDASWLYGKLVVTKMNEQIRPGTFLRLKKLIHVCRRGGKK